jgi:cell division protein FtsN
MSVVVIEDQSPIMHRAKIRLGIALTLLVIALVSLILAGESKAPISVPPSPALVSAPKVVELPEEDAPAPAVYEALPSFQSFTAEPEPASDPSPVTIPPTVAEAPAEPNKKPSGRIEASATGDLILQVGVFADMNNAEKRREDLSRHGVGSRLESKLRIGPFNENAELEAARERLQSSGISIPFTDESTSRGLMLRAGALSDLSSLRQLQSSLEELGFTTRTETRVLVGPFDNKNTLDAARKKIRELNMAVALMPNR